ncbi:hypothetical protein TBLA_0G00230 [Henningerozyma blattae CBS 6284]|uniref:Pop1 N-terminal domain-containing protein n=1 Tax=Henningerozyma blattae (strain ATCC 34711 / CBS 6284 / DSM 70876 / NBRC 10599 / NRRL Y-10934 / UCD 77-7) TaxID=1071380 RepID=I2H6H1_HENB6|nr:hypothetical protein TBLA_0G00230 [Tetrapisispora blattae CBS 6284]CCH61973.1 hypothetical protein TBLA_0G00230 [Tetrapisispora blattae CBS 6284]
MARSSTPNSSSSGGKKLLNKNQLFKRNKIANARIIRSQAVTYSLKDKSNDSEVKELSESGGMLNVNTFIDSRSYEIKQLQLAIHNSKNSNSTRVFQDLPRKLRRRTASHNVRRIPKRLRNRAIKEMLKTDQQTIKKKKSNNSQKNGLTSRQLYRAKMSVKLLRLATKTMALKLSLPDELLGSRTVNLRSKIKALQNLIKNQKNAKKNTKNSSIAILNNQLGCYDNTGINELAPKLKGRIKYIKRQSDFIWLTTHVWNAKRCHMIKRWGYQIPWSPTQKCFRLAHRIGNDVAKSDGALVQDTSFIGTLILIHKDSAILINIISRLINQKKISSKYIQSSYWFSGLCYDINSNDLEILGSVELLWLNPTKVMIRLHPSIYATVFKLLQQLDDKDLILNDCRYSLGSITIKGAKSLTALSSILRTPTNDSQSFKLFKKIASITDSSVLPKRCLFGLNAIDPRFLNKPQPLTKESISIDDIIELNNKFIDSSIKDEYNQVVDDLTNPSKRNESYKNFSTLKQLARRRQSLLSHPNQNSNFHFNNTIQFNPKRDSSIPLLLIRRPKENDWVLIVPWFWILPFWYQLNRISRIHHSGLRQFQQLNFERKKLYFPDDYPFTKIGYLENSLYKSQASRLRWEKKPLSKRVNYSKIKDIHRIDTVGNQKVELLNFNTGELGDYFSCDWKFLQILHNGIKYLLQENNNSSINLINSNRTSQFDENGNRLIEVVNDLFEYYKDIVSQASFDNSTLPICLKNAQPKSKWSRTDINITPLPVMPISCTMMGKGHPKDNARIYKIPQKDVTH